MIFIALLIYDKTFVFPLIVFGDKQKEEWGIPYSFQHQLLIKDGPKTVFFQQIFLNQLPPSPPPSPSTHLGNFLSLFAEKVRF